MDLLEGNCLHDSKSFLLWCRKSSDLEEELKNVTNNLKSLEAASEKVGCRETWYILFCPGDLACARVLVCRPLSMGVVLRLSLSPEAHLV